MGKEHCRLENSKCKGPEVEMYLTCWRNSKEAVVVGAELSEGGKSEQKGSEQVPWREPLGPSRSV